MTSESPSQTEPWVAKHGMKYAYAYDKGSALFRGVGASGYPSAVLVDAKGTIVYAGHPGSINDSVIEGALDGALATPIFEWPKELGGVAKLIRKGDLGGAVTELAKLGEAHADVAKAVQGMVTGRVAALEKARDAGDWLAVESNGKALLKGLGKLEEAAKVKEILDALDKDKDAQEILKAQQKIEKIFAGEIKKNQFDKVKKDLDKIREDLPGTAAARDALAGLEKLKALRAR